MAEEKSQKTNVANGNIIFYPMSTEKSMRLIESENKLVFVVDRRATRKEIKDALESLYGIKIEKINVLINRDGNKQAFVKLTQAFSALDIATDLGIM